MSFDINYVAVLVSTLSFVGIGFAWYSSYLFGKEWRRLSGISEETMQARAGKDMTRTYVLLALGAFVTSYVLAHFVAVWSAYAGYFAIEDALMLGFWVWLGFVAPVMLGGVLWEQKPWRLYLINAGYQLVAFAVASYIFLLFQ